MIGNMRLVNALIWLASLLTLGLGTWVTCHQFHGELPDGRWENAIGGGRITETIRLEDQHGETDD